MHEIGVFLELKGENQFKVNAYINAARTLEILEEDLSELNRLSIKLMLNKMSNDSSKIALNELVDPCNILIPMSGSGKIGFGHLRYQEHLAAKELVSNRAINVLKFHNQPWWTSVLILFARMCEDLTWLIQEIGKNKQMKFYRKFVISLLKERPQEEQYRLESLIDQYLLLEGYDQEQL